MNRDPNPKQLTLKIARAKAEALLEKVKQPAILITSDQVIVCAGEIREKPESIGTVQLTLISINIKKRNANSFCAVIKIIQLRHTQVWW